MQLFVDNITVIDCSVLCPSHGVDGRSWICDIVLEGALDSQSMVMDFGVVKKRIKQEIDRIADHCLLVPEQSDSLTHIQSGDAGISLTWQVQDRYDIRLKSPQEAICLLPMAAVTPEALARWLEEQLSAVVSESVERVSITLREEAIDGPSYSYSHGLKKHDGNCQRIAHGHRSRLEIWQDGRPAVGLVAAWCKAWDHIYVGSRDDLVAEFEQYGQPMLRYAYDAPQGAFMLEIPADRCAVIDSDSTVECIAAHIARTLSAQYPQSVFRVKAYEGVGKGAIAAGGGA